MMGRRGHNELAAHYHVRRLHSGTDSFSKFWPYFIAGAPRMQSRAGQDIGTAGQVK